MARQEILEWDSIAHQYAGWLTGPNDPVGRAFTDVVTTAMLKVIGDPVGSVVLDMGCGEGYLARTLAQMGATVEGVDGAAGMIAIAEQSSASLPITFRQADICAPLPYPDNHFDLIVCNMVLMDVDDLNAAIRHAERVLTPGGRFVFSIVHPCFFDATLDWWTGPDGRPEFAPRERYVVPSRFEKTLFGFDPPAKLTHHHRPIQDYIRAVIIAGLNIFEFIETSMPEYPEHPELRRFHMTANNLIIATRK